MKCKRDLQWQSVHMNSPQSMHTAKELRSEEVMMMTMVMMGKEAYK